MKRYLIRAVSLALMLTLVLSVPVVAKADSINLGMQVEKGTDTITVTIENSTENNGILAEQTPTLIIPCAFEEAYVTNAGRIVSSTLADGQISFTVDQGGTYTIISGAHVSHSGGTATCKDKAVCAICGESYGELDPANHAGETEVRNAKAVTCTVNGYTGDTYCVGCGTKLADGETITAQGHEMGGWTATEVAGEERRDCSNCDHYETRTAELPENVLKVEDEDLKNQSQVWIDGTACPVVKDGDKSYIQLPENAEIDAGSSMVAYEYKESSSADRHTQYPTGMQVWIMKEDEQGNLKPTYVPDLDNILGYCGTSIRITGKQGIRMITSIDQGKKNALIAAGLGDYKLLEYGTAVCWSDDLIGDKPMTLDQSYVKSNYAYKKNVADPVFKYVGREMQYTNVLVGFSMEECKKDIAMRPYMILEGPEGEQVTVYGGIVHRSIGYIAYRNRDAFAVGSDAYDYVWDIIHYVYGNKYDADYKG